MAILLILGCWQYQTKKSLKLVVTVRSALTVCSFQSLESYVTTCVIWIVKQNFVNNVFNLIYFNSKSQPTIQENIKKFYTLYIDALVSRHKNIFMGHVHLD